MPIELNNGTNQCPSNIKNQHKHGGDSVIKIYGTTKNLNDDNYMIVMEFANQGTDGLNTIHEANLMHKDLHSGNMVDQTLYSSYITDFGLCKPVSQDSSTEGIFGVIPYITPEVLYTGGKEYTQKSDIYSFGIIMPEIKCEVLQLLSDLMNKCLDAKPQNRPTANELAGALNQFSYGLINKNGELYKQVKEIKNSGKKSNQVTLTRLKYQTHKQAIYKSAVELSKSS
ncbi:kinase-like domain-containing protein [Gigaspora rosea]|uniref:Kinase-like domain-containing protein n=1 Tax=Gigaspora rosea TaxID=44941 RepID=A0A397VJA7_9GLOM|nr:kinase-like domain-containing protein [Gigaspora rosea]